MYEGSVASHFPTPASHASVVAPAKLLDGSGEYVPAGTSNQPAQGSSCVREWGTITGSRHLPKTLAVCVDDVGKVAGEGVTESVAVAEALDPDAETPAS